MRHLLILLIPILFQFSFSNQQKIDSEIERILLNSLTEAFKDKGMDLSIVLDDFETYLVDDGILESASGQAYYDYYIRFIELRDNFIFIDYDGYNAILEVSNSDYYSDNCLAKINALDSTSLANSLYTKMNFKIKEAVLKNGITASVISKAITTVLKPSDFDKKYYRAIALLVIAYTSMPIEFKPSHDNNSQVEDVSGF